MKAQELEPFIKTIERLLEDTQERLVYRSNIYIETNIKGYTPSAGDLAYPEKLEMMKVILVLKYLIHLNNNYFQSIAENLNDSKSEVSDIPEERVRTRSDSVSSSHSDISFATNERSYERVNRESRSMSTFIYSSNILKCFVKH